MKTIFALVVCVLVLIASGCSKRDSADVVYFHPTDNLVITVRFEEVDADSFHQAAKWWVFEDGVEVFSGKMFVAPITSELNVPFEFTGSNGTSGVGYLQKDSVQFIIQNVTVPDYIELFNRLNRCQKTP